MARPLRLEFTGALYHVTKPEAGVRSFIIIFDIYVIHNTFEKYDNKRPDPICLIHMFDYV